MGLGTKAWERERDATANCAIATCKMLLRGTSCGQKLAFNVSDSLLSCCMHIVKVSLSGETFLV